MRPSFRLPPAAVAAALFALIAALATLQYVWLGRVSDAERESRRSTLAARTAALAEEFDKELTFAYLLFQADPLIEGDAPAGGLAGRLRTRLERWQAAARFPRLVRQCLVVSRGEDGGATLQRFQPEDHSLETIAWPPALDALRRQVLEAPAPLQERIGDGAAKTFMVRRLAGPVWDDVPALVVPLPLLLLQPPGAGPRVRLGGSLLYTVLMLDEEYIQRELLPALVARHLSPVSDGTGYHVAVVKTTGGDAVFRSSSSFAPKPDDRVDAAADLFQVRTQEFAHLAADVRRWAAGGPASEQSVTATIVAPGDVPFQGRASRMIARESIETGRGRAVVTSVAGMSAAAAPRWRLMVKHPAGSLEAAVESTRRRNLLISSSVIAVLAASVALLVSSTRRAQAVARQQMEFVAAVSHELRTPLAVIRSAGENLADGVVHEPAQVRRYGDLVRGEGRRLSDMVEQILEFAGIQSGQRRFAPKPVAVQPVVDDVLRSSSALIEAAGMTVECDLPQGLPAVDGDEAAIRRVVQNLVGNAIKYGAPGRWIGIRARVSGEFVALAVSDRGIGIAAADQARIFDPFYRAADVVAAQIHGAGLGLSLVQRIVSAHGGRMAVRSAPGEGSEFTVYLPIAAGRRPDAHAGAAAPEAARPA